MAVVDFASPRVSWALMTFSALISVAAFAVALTHGFDSQMTMAARSAGAAPAAALAGTAIYFPAKAKTLRKRTAFRIFGLVTFLAAAWLFAATLSR